MATRQRINIYLDEEQLRLLRYLAAESRQSVADHVRQAVTAYLAGQRADPRWGDRLEQVLERVRARVPAGIPPAKIEADITAARAETRQARRAARGR